MQTVELIQAKLQGDSDFLRVQTHLSRFPVLFLGYSSLIDFPSTLDSLQLQAQNALSANQSSHDFMNGIGQVVDEPEASAFLADITRGYLIVYFIESRTFVRLSPVAKVLTRAIEAPTTENVLRGSISSFVEEIETNIGMLKKHAASDQLRVNSYLVGSVGRKQISLLYMEGIAKPELIRSITEKLESGLGREVQNLQQLSLLLGFTRWTLVSKFNSSELPQDALYGLNQGKVVIFLDRMPFALIIPSMLADLFTVENDRNFPYIFMYLVRLLRAVGVLINVIVPGLYVALISVNPDVLRIELALSIAKSRSDVPYPAIVETLLLLAILELILEASIRLPKSIGPTLTMVGGIILGQAVVSAKLVSNLLIIILAATTISSSTVVGFQNSISIRIFKYLLLFLSAVYGVLGLLSGVVVICAYLASITSFGIPYAQLLRPKGDSRG
ncbi:spore germination protein [Paenibacillus sp. GCM10027627]|uniref:spore germination protein n=1 Tax=unclassified Paenibacillus TaxID=185978 RepID=UPI00362BC1F6